MKDMPVFDGMPDCRDIRLSVGIYEFALITRKTSPIKVNHPYKLQQPVAVIGKNKRGNLIYFATDCLTLKGNTYAYPGDWNTPSIRTSEIDSYESLKRMRLS